MMLGGLIRVLKHQINRDLNTWTTHPLDQNLPKTRRNVGYTLRTENTHKHLNRNFSSKS
uniref:Uncharacterized protein n=1 Tax=Rhizophora mucronata TaxID=61149 RepID=A0A2P2P5N6_RHIMU